MLQSVENIRLVLADPNPQIRNALRGALNAKGFRAITETASFVRVHDLLEQDSVDLLISASELEGNDVGFLVSEMRNQRLGRNPFVVTITLLGNANPDRVKKVIDSGTDDLVLVPVAPDTLLARIANLLKGRKPFVVTHDYVGPDRRTRTRSFVGHQAPMLDVPNPLRLRAETGIDGTKLDRQVRESGAQLNRLKIERHAVQINWLADHVHATIRDGLAEEADKLMPFTSKLLSVADDLMRRMRGTPAEAHGGPVEELREISHRLDSNPCSVAYGDLERLNNLAKSIMRAMGSTTSHAQVA